MEKLKKKLAEKRVFIYGGGTYGKALYELLLVMGVKIDGFLMTKKEIDLIFDVPVYSYEDKKDTLGNGIIFIAIQNRTIFNEIKTKLNNDKVSALILDGVNLVEDSRLSRKNTSSTEKICNVCKNFVEEFIADGIKSDLFKKYHIIGSGYRNNCVCPHCGSIDRTRWMLYVLDNYTDIHTMESGRVLHFAPEVAVSRWICENIGIDYYTGDIIPRKAMHVTDITNIDQYANNTFDYIIANHVFEHIVEIEKAVNELKRVLKPNGKLIFSFPICTDMKTIEDKNITSDEERLKQYGQEDHVRLYGTDYIDIFKAYDLNINIYSPENCIGKEIIEKHGFIRDDVTMIATK